MRENLSERQLTAQALGREIEKMGAWVTSPLPLDDTCKLRFQVLDRNRDAVVAKLAEWEWAPRLLSSYPRVCSEGFLPSSLYEIDIPGPPPVVDDRKIYDEVFRGKSKEDPTGILKYLGLDKK
jgi:hypothetical protein